MDYRKKIQISDTKCQEDSEVYEISSDTEYPYKDDESDKVVSSTGKNDLEDVVSIEIPIEKEDGTENSFTLDDDSKPAELSAVDVAAYILQKKGEMSTIKLQKLVYYCQAWSLVWDEAPLFKNRIEAWANGPVIPDLFDLHKGLFLINYDIFPYGNSDKLTDNQKETVDAVLDYYGDRPAQWLVELSHMEAPWKNSRAGLHFGTPSKREIKQDEIAQYYSSLNEQEKE